MEIRSIFATRITNLRKRKGLTQGELAEKLGISRQSITLYENKSRIPDIEVLRRFANYFGVTSDYLIGLSDNIKAENAVTGDELGLSDRAIECLKMNRHCRQSIFDLTFGEYRELRGYFKLLAYLAEKHSIIERSELLKRPEILLELFDTMPEYSKNNTDLINDIILRTQNNDEKMKVCEEKYHDIISEINILSEEYGVSASYLFSKILSYESSKDFIICNFKLVTLLSDYLYHDTNRNLDDIDGLREKDKNEKRSFADLIELLIDIRNNNKNYVGGTNNAEENQRQE